MTETEQQLSWVQIGMPNWKWKELPWWIKRCYLIELGLITGEKLDPNRPSPSLQEQYDKWLAEGNDPNDYAQQLKHERELQEFGDDDAVDPIWRDKV